MMSLFVVDLVTFRDRFVVVLVFPLALAVVVECGGCSWDVVVVAVVMVVGGFAERVAAAVAWWRPGEYRGVLSDVQEVLSGVQGVLSYVQEVFSGVQGVLSGYKGVVRCTGVCGPVYRRCVVRCTGGVVRNTGMLSGVQGVLSGVQIVLSGVQGVLSDVQGVLS